MTGKRNEHGLTPKQEAFCQAYQETPSLSDAYRAAYTVQQEAKPEAVHSAAWEVAHKPAVAARMLALQEARVANPLHDRAKLEEFFLERVVYIIRDDQRDRAAAVTLLGKYLGVFVEKAEVRKSVTVTDAETKLTKLLEAMAEPKPVPAVQPDSQAIDNVTMQ